jgi:hypothetical protein
MQHFPLTEKLHTDVLEEKYGSITSKVLKHNDTVRESLLVDQLDIARTYALTFLSGKFSGKIKLINEDIKKGKPIGKAFREQGYIIRKNVLDVFIIKIPKWLKKEFQTSENHAKARLSEFYAKKIDSKPVIYGIVTEVYTPDFRKAVVNKVDKSQISAITKCLEQEGFDKTEIWTRIGNENNYDDVLLRFKTAKKNSNLIIKKLRLKIEKEIQNLR